MRKAIPLLILGILLVVTAVLTYPRDEGKPAEYVDWQLTLVGSNGEEKILAYDEILEMPAYEGRGGSFSTVGVISGPYDIKENWSKVGLNPLTRLEHSV